MTRKVNGFVGAYSTIAELTSKFPPIDYTGCFANIGNNPTNKAICNGEVWSEIQTSVSGAGTRRLAANRVGPSGAVLSNASTLAGTEVQQWFPLTLPYAGADLEFQWANYTANNGTYSRLEDGPTAITIRAGLKIGSVVYPIYWQNGSRDITIDPGGVAVGRVSIMFSAGTAATLQYRVIQASASTWPSHYLVNSSGFNEFGAALTDRTLATSWSGGARATNYVVYPPSAITAVAIGAPGPVVAILGDSIGSWGNNDSTFGVGIGFIQRALMAAYPWVNIGASGAAVNALVGTSNTDANSRRRKWLSLADAGVTHALCNLVTNDFASSRTNVDVLADMQTLKTELDAFGVKLITMTCPPRTNSTNDAKVTADSASAWSWRRDYNAAVRDNNGVGYGYFDFATHTQDPASIDLWRTDLGTPTIDGIHPATVIHTQAAAQLAAALPALLT